MNILKSINDKITGYRTHSAALGLILVNVAAVLAGEQTLVEAVSWFFVGGGLSALRAAKG